MLPDKTIRVELPLVKPRKTWCERILRVVMAETSARGITYEEGDRLALEVRVYLSGRTLPRSDVDNLLVKLMNGLQGQIGGQRKNIMHPTVRVSRNDRQVWRAQIEKLERPDEISPDVGGQLTISCL
jgi:hypothetical protein